MSQSHENYNTHTTTPTSSNRSFGVVFAVVFLLIGLWPILGSESVRIWALAISAAFLFLAMLLPQWLALPNRLWLRFGLLMHRIVSPLVMGFLFFVTVTPMAIAFRLLGKDPLRLKKDHGAKTYWILLRWSQKIGQGAKVYSTG